MSTHDERPVGHRSGGADDVHPIPAAQQPAEVDPPIRERTHHRRTEADPDAMPVRQPGPQRRDAEPGAARGKG
ncbi:hypothetical protein [Embleya hyalina]|uniref:hypothetical protein n=1 Tax=Embleya hyalina TaxID=516124 RepID=UPI000F81BFB0|nr:hypothetical protein [Embleya hyalina]